MAYNPIYSIQPGDTQPKSQVKATYVDANSGIDKEAFLKLLVAQLRYQDPMAPMQDRDFIAQMAQISSLEQSQNSAKTQRMGQAANLMGKQVEYLNMAKLKVLTARVDKVLIEEGEPKLVVVGPDPKDSTKEITATIELGSLRTILPEAEPDAADDSGSDTASGSGQ